MRNLTPEPGAKSTDARSLQQYFRDFIRGGSHQRKTRRPEENDAAAEPAREPRITDLFHRFQPRSLDDRDISHKVFNLLDTIDIHVENFYRNSAVVLQTEAIEELAVFDSDCLPQSVAAMIQQSQSPKSLIAHCLSRVVVWSIDPFERPSSSFLPREYAIFHGLRGNEDAESQFAMYWLRMMTVHLRPNMLEDTDFLARRNKTISKKVATLSRAFEAWRHPQYPDEEREQNLTRILENASDVGVLLFSQPSTFEFRWKHSQALGPQTIEISPELVKVADKNGLNLSEYQLLVKGVSAKFYPS